MASLFNTKISDTYPGLIKTIDNAAISASLKQLTDGSGNQSGLYINTAGDFKATGILEFGSLKDTGEDITITKFVDEADGIANNDNDTTIPTSAAIVDYVASQVTLEDLDFSGDSGNGSVDLDSQTFAIVGTANEIETSASGQQLQVGIVDNPTITGVITSDGLDVGDSEKIRLGTGNDLEIYHTGSHSYLTNATGSLEITTTGNLILQDASSNKWLMTNQSGNVLLYSAGSVKLNTKSTGVDITGDLYATGTLEVTSTGQSSFAGQVTIPETPSANTDAASKAYVDSQVTAQDLDFVADGGSGSVDLDSQNLVFNGSANITTAAANQTVTFNLNSDLVSLDSVTATSFTGDLTGDVTGDLTGNVTATSVLADGVTATTQTDGDNSTKVATTAYVDTAIQGHDTLAEVLTGGNTTGGTNIAVSANDDITFTDTSKAIFGDGSDLQIYHEGTDSYIKDAGTGNLNINADQLVFKSSSNTETKAIFNTNGAVELYYDDSKKLETNPSGVVITGDADVSGNITVGTNNTLLAENALRFNASGDSNIDQNNIGSSLYIRTSNAASLDTNAVIIASDGDIDLSGSLTIAQDLTVNGTTTTVNTQTLAVEDPLISLAKDNAANSVDIGFYGRYNDGSNRYLGLYSDASDTNTFKLFKGTTTEPTTTVDSTATGYALADLDLANLEVNGEAVIDGGTGVSSSGTLHVRQKGDTSNDGITITSSNATSHRIYKDVNGVLNIGPSTNANAFNQDLSGNVNFEGNVSLGDNNVLQLGNSADLKIYHDGSNSYIDDSGSGRLNIRSNDLRIEKYTGETIAKFIADGAIELNYDDVKKFETTSTGVQVSGTSLKLTTSSSLPVIDIETTHIGGIPILNLKGAHSSQVRYQDENGDNQSRIDFTDDGTFSFINAAGGTTAKLNIPNSSYQISGGTGNGDLRFLAPRFRFYEDAIAGTPLLALDGGNATFAGDITFGDSHFIGDDADNNLVIESSTNENIVINSADEILFRTGDGTTRFQIGDTLGKFVGSSYQLKFTTDDGSTQLGKLYDDTGFTLEGKMNNNLNIRSLANGNDEGIKFQNKTGGVTTTNMFLTKQGYLGINEDVPLVPLHISRDSASGENIALILDNNDTTVGAEIGMLFRCNTNSTNSDYEIFAKSYGSNDSALVFQSDGSVETFRLNKNGSQEWNMSNATVAISGSTGGNVTLSNTTGEWQFRANGSSVNSMNITSSLVTLNENTQVNGQLSISSASPELFLNADSGTDYEIVNNSGGSLMFKDSTLNFPMSAIQIVDGSTGSSNAFNSTTLQLFSGAKTGWGVGDIHGRIDFYGFDTSGIGARNAASIRAVCTTGNGTTTTTFNGALDFYTSGSNASEAFAMRLTSDKNLCIGTISTRPDVDADPGIAINPDGKIYTYSTSDFGVYDTSTTGKKIYFRLSGTEIGSIQFNTNAVAYNTTSDYRLKEDLQDFNGLDKILQIPVYDFKWKSDGSRSYGVIAHELQSVLPDAVGGEKDATEEYEVTPAVLDEDNNVIEEAVMGTRDDYQGVDYSKIVPLLVKSIQELKAEIEELKRK